ncbi:MAG: hypothetical protein COX29_00440 [Candidatus Moranbacteria bacterium CG23_combo_of_CG06-09_8_20_14_all_35_22]|nr:MAG: hypothetical protein COX29_00440 [Candidatus Moranbacteria bacterium CG23_combo_of_CG06-09_8_20_14_all_35_22]
MLVHYTLSLRYNSISLIIVSILGGFATPFLVSNGQNNQIGLLSYILLLDLAILVVSIFKKWRTLNIIGFIGTIIVFSVWAGEYYERKDLFLTMFFLTLFFITYSISSLIYNLVKKENSTGIEQVLTLFTGVVYFLASFILLDHDYHIIMGFFALVLATYYFLWAYSVRILTPEDKNLYDFLAFLTIGFITITMPIQFKQNIITISWTIEAVILFILGMRLNKESLKVFGFVIFGLVLLKLLSFDSVYKNTYLTIFNKVSFTFLFVIMASYISAFIFKKLSENQENENKFLNIKQIIASFIIIANLLTIFIGSREIMFFWNKKIEIFRNIENNKNLEKKRLAPLNSYNSNYYRSDDVYYEQVKKMKNKSSVSLSIFWLIYGIILMSIGIFGKYKAVRIGGMLLFILAILKLFFYDLWELGTLYRIISSISLGIVLLGISFSYQKYKEKLREII